MIQELFSINVGEPLSSLALSKELLAVGTLDENAFVFSVPCASDSKPKLKFSGHLMGVVDLQINNEETQLCVSSLDSIIRVWNIDDRRIISEFKCDVYSNWRARFYDSQSIISIGDLGAVIRYHIDTKERMRKIETDPIYFAQSMDTRNQDLLVGNEGGSLFFFNSAFQMTSGRIHNKPIRTVKFFAENLALTGSDDGLIKLVDLAKLTVVQSYRGHKYDVSDIVVIDEKHFASCSMDRTIRVWDKDQIYSQRFLQCGNDKPQGLSAIEHMNGRLVVAHDCGLVAFYGYN